MNTSLLIFLLILLGLPAAYAIMRWFRISRRNNKQKMLAEAYEKLVLNHRLVIRLYDIIGNAVIALDADNKKLGVVDLRKQQPQQYCISLRSINETEVIQHVDPSGKITGVHLRLQSADRNYDICFFDTDSENISEGELLMQRAQEWRMRIYSLQQLNRNIAKRG
jgi:hypothetical protein